MEGWREWRNYRFCEIITKLLKISATAWKLLQTFELKAFINLQLDHIQYCYCYLHKLLFISREYYFSEENLMKDLFLRRKMDAEGYLPVTLIASFHRVRALTTDINKVISAIQASKKLQLVDNFKVSIILILYFSIIFISFI